MNPDEKTTLSHGLKKHFSAIELSDYQFEQLTQRFPPAQPVRPLIHRWFSRFFCHLQKKSYHYASAFLVFFAITLSWTFIKPVDLSRQVIEEIAYNHNKQVAMEVNTSALPDITRHLSQLGFSLIDSQQLNNHEWELLGGRYCSIQGKLAAQLKLRNVNENRTYTFYQAILPDPLLDLKTYEGYVDGIKVALWQENNLLLGLAGQPVH